MLIGWSILTYKKADWNVWTSCMLTSMLMPFGTGMSIVALLSGNRASIWCNGGIRGCRADCPDFLRMYNCMIGQRQWNHLHYKKHKHP